MLAHCLYWGNLEMDDLKVSKDSTPNNALFGYEYTRLWFAGVNDAIDNLASKNIVILVTNAILAGFAAQFGHSILLRSSIAVSASFAIFSLLPRSVSGLVPPEEILEKEWYYAPKDECFRYVAGGLMDAIGELKKLRDMRRLCLAASLVPLLFSFFLILLIE